MNFGNSRGVVRKGRGLKYIISGALLLATFSLAGVLYAQQVNTTPVITNIAGRLMGDYQLEKGGAVMITGSYLAGNTVDTTKVFIGGLQATITTLSDNMIWFTSPASLQPGRYDVFVSNEKGKSNVMWVNIVGAQQVPAQTILPQTVPSQSSPSHISDTDISNDNSCAIINSNIRYLSRDANGSTDVSILQDFLNTRGYLKSQPTGFFGSATRRAVIAFQNDNSIRATPAGYVGPSTRAKIQEIDCNDSNTTSMNTAPVKNTQNSDNYKPTKTYNETSNESLILSAPIVKVNVSPARLVLGQSTILSWNAISATRCTLQNDSNQENISTSGTKTITPIKTSTYFISCSNDTGTGKDGKSSSQSITVVVSDQILSSPIINFQATPQTIGEVQSSNLTWSVSNASRCVMQYGASEENVSISGSKSVTPQQTTSYRLICTNDTGSTKDGPSAEKIATVSTVNPSCSLTTDKGSYKYGETITFSWTSKNATYAAFYQDNSGKDHLWLPGDRLNSIGTQIVTANVLGYADTTLLIYNYTGSSSCKVIIPITQ